MHRGALVTSTGAYNVAPNNASYMVKFGTIVYDTDGFFDPASPTKLTIPSGVSKIRVGVQIICAQNPNGIRQIVTAKNYPVNGGFFPGCVANNTNANNRTTTDINGWSSVVDVVPGDVFELQVFQNCGGALELPPAPGTFLALEVVE